MGKTHLSQSLRTSVLSEALRTVRKIAYEIELEFERVRSSETSTVIASPPSLTASFPVVLDTSPKVAKPTLGQTITAYMNDPTRSLTAKSEAVYKTTFATISTILGADTLIADIGRDACRDLLTVIQRLPSNARKRFPTMTPREAAEHAAATGIAPMSVANINEYMNKLSVLLNWALREEWVTRNSASGIRVAASTSRRDRRRPFSIQQLTRIFNAPLYRGCRDDEHNYAKVGKSRPRRARFWIPLIGLFTGMRLNEICQLHTADLRQIDGFWCFDVSAHFVARCFRRQCSHHS
ncbi:MAG TPA: hypothetical protein PK823_15510, partial [Novosphingobium sp.]|nr:hypothetical protein [Novosphingobium sp. 17-62-19]HQS97890.1 hypothetical protein [Novosphingobium sp.]